MIKCELIEKDSFPDVKNFPKVSICETITVLILIELNQLTHFRRINDS